jgi:hypothetical protein
MSVLTRKRYRALGDLVLRDAEGLPRRLQAGDELDAPVLAALSAGEIAALEGHGGIVELGRKAPPPPPPPPPAPRKPSHETLAELLALTGWAHAGLRTVASRTVRAALSSRFATSFLPWGSLSVSRRVHRKVSGFRLSRIRRVTAGL